VAAVAIAVVVVDIAVVVANARVVVEERSEKKTRKKRNARNNEIRSSAEFILPFKEQSSNLATYRLFIQWIAATRPLRTLLVVIIMIVAKGNNKAPTINTYNRKKPT
jgi:hypothetical protein